MASSYSGYKPLSTIADVDVKGPGQYKNISDLTGILGGVHLLSNHVGGGARHHINISAQLIF